MVIPFAGYRGQGHRGGTPLALRGVPVAIVPHRENDIIRHVTGAGGPF